MLTARASWLSCRRAPPGPSCACPEVGIKSILAKVAGILHMHFRSTILSFFENTHLQPFTILRFAHKGKNLICRSVTAAEWKIQCPSDDITMLFMNTSVSLHNVTLHQVNTLLCTFFPYKNMVCPIITVITSRVRSQTAPLSFSILSLLWLSNREMSSTNRSQNRRKVNTEHGCQYRAYRIKWISQFVSFCKLKRH